MPWVTSTPSRRGVGAIRNTGRRITRAETPTQAATPASTWANHVQGGPEAASERRKDRASAMPSSACAVTIRRSVRRVGGGSVGIRTRGALRVELADRAQVLLELLGEPSAHEVAEVEDRGVGDAVVGHQAVLPPLDQTCPTQDLQVLAHVRLAGAGGLHERSHGAFALFDDVQQPQTQRVAHHPESLRHEPQTLVFHSVTAITGRGSFRSLAFPELHRYITPCRCNRPVINFIVK